MSRRLAAASGSACVPWSGGGVGAALIPVLCVSCVYRYLYLYLLLCLFCVLRGRYTRHRRYGGRRGECAAAMEIIRAKFPVAAKLRDVSPEQVRGWCSRDDVPMSPRVRRRSPLRSRTAARGGAAGHARCSLQARAARRHRVPPCARGCARAPPPPPQRAVPLSLHTHTHITQLRTRLTQARARAQARTSCGAGSSPNLAH